MSKQIEALKLALEAMGLIGADLVCEAAHHAKKDRHEIGKPCPIQARWHRAFAAIREALAEQPAQQQDANDRFMTVVYRNVQEDDAKSFTEHPKAVWFGWCHAPYQRDEARYKLEKVSASPQPSKPWVGLTDEDKLAIRRLTWETPEDLIDNTEAKLKERNT